VLRGGDGDDWIKFSYQASNTVEGGAGNDTLLISSTTNQAQPNTINGGTGDDTMTSGLSADTYLINRGDGRDIIRDYGGADKIVFGAGIAQGDLQFSRLGSGSGYDLLVRITDPQNPAATDQVTVQDWFRPGSYQIEQLVLADGSVLSNTQVSALGNLTVGPAASITADQAATLVGFNQPDSIL